jgi:hypothetical protein
MAAKSLDKILCGAALLVMLSSLAWTLTQGGKRGGANSSSRTDSESPLYVPTNLSEFRVNTPVWTPPPAQSGGAEWIYDVFTPPEIYYDQLTKRFTVTPPNSNQVVVAKPVEPPFGVELVSVKEDAFRLQLVGYTGKPGNYRGTFENALSGKTILGQAGLKIPDLGLTIVSFEVNQIRTAQGTGKTVIIETEAVAQVADDKTGEVFKLTNKSRLTKGTPITYLKAEGSAEPVAYKVGAKFTVGDATFTVNSVSFETNEVVLTKESAALKQPLTKTLRVAGPAAPVPAVTVPAPAATPAAAPTGASLFSL